MRTVDRSITLPAPADAVWGAVCTPGAFRVVTRGLVRLPVLATRVEPWREGETVSGLLLLGGVLPLSRHHLHVTEIDHGRRRMVSDEHGGLIRRWHHEITVEPIDESTCRYRDLLEIDAGPLTAVVTAWASGFYRIRQRRWWDLAAALTPVPGS